ncbi:MAG: GAF domain-containing protein [Burkholderiales bacterium]|nr:GAF domain-containing protein [Burkholderiales bacterium]
MARAAGFERLTSGILASLLVAPTDAEDDIVVQGLQRIGAFMRAERVTLWERIPEQRDFRRSYQWCATSSLPAEPSIPGNLPWLGGRLSAGCVVRFSDLTQLPVEAHDDLPSLRAAKIRSLLAVPISVHDAVVGAFTIASTVEQCDWPDSAVSGAELLAKVFATLSERQSMQGLKQAAEIEAALWRERLAHLVRVHTVGEMSVALAHEITQPLGAIENYALAARRRAGAKTPDMARIVDLLDKVVGQATRAGDVVSRMRGMARRHDLDPKEIDVERAIGECAEMLKAECEAREIRVEFDVSDHELRVVADEIHLQQVIMNLLRNAMQAMGDTGSGVAKVITIAIGSDASDEVSVQIADRGPGIADNDIERVFESFYSTKSDGLGVGLAICRRLIEAHGGRLWAIHNPGGGAIFRFTLPAAHANA